MNIKNNKENIDCSIPNSMLFSKSLSSSRPETCPLKHIKNFEINFKNIELLKKYLSEKGRIIPSKVTGISCIKQKFLRKAIKIARHIALLAYTKNKI